MSKVPEYSGPDRTRSYQTFFNAWQKVGVFIKDVSHSQKEKRYILLGNTTEEKLLFVVFTLRNKKIRIITTRKANGKEKNRHAQEV